MENYWSFVAAATATKLGSAEAAWKTALCSSSHFTNFRKMFTQPVTTSVNITKRFPSNTLEVIAKAVNLRPWWKLMKQINHYLIRKRSRINRYTLYTQYYPRHVLKKCYYGLHSHKKYALLSYLLVAFSKDRQINRILSKNLSLPKIEISE